MRSAVIGVAILLLSGLAVASHGPVEDTLSVEVGMDEFGEDFHAVHPEEGVVTFVAAYSNVPLNDSEGSRREPAMYDNTSLERWAAMQGNDKGIPQIGKRIADRYGNETAQKLSVGVTSADGHEYLIEVHPSNSGLTKDELRAVVPDEVEATVQYPHDTVTVVMPVEVEDAKVIGHQAGAVGNDTYQIDDGVKEPSLLSTVITILQDVLSGLVFW